MAVTAENLKAFLDRDWAASRASKDRAVARFVEQHGAAGAFRLAQALLDQAWPRLKRDARGNIDGLVEMRRKLDRANARGPLLHAGP